MKRTFLVLELFGALRRYGRWGEVAVHLLKAEREVLSAMAVVVRSIRAAAAPYAKDDPFAALLHEVFKFFERGMLMLMPGAPNTGDHVAVHETQRQALLAIRDVLVEERASVTPDAARAEFRAQVIDSILRVIDLELERIGLPEGEREASEVDALELDALEDERAQALPVEAGAEQH